MSAVVDLTRRLVALPTAGGGEVAAAELAAQVLEDAGWRVRLVPWRDGRAQVVATLGAPREGALCLCGHLDTVPADPAGWSRDPLGGDVADGFVHGRGTTDMKGGVAAILVAGAALAAGRRTATAAAGTVIALTAGEETGCEGAYALAAEPELASAGGLLIPEPTANRLVVGHRGALWVRLRATGRGGHASMPARGDSALARLRAALDAVEAAAPVAATPDPLLGEATLAVTGLHAGSAVNVLPERAEATLDIRTIPATPSAEVLARLRAAAGPEVEVEVIIDCPAVRGPLDGRLAGALRRAGVADAAPPAAPYFTDASALALPGVEVAVVGPGDPDQAHRVDERCRVDRLEESAALLEAAAAGWAEAA
jgi:succinyl-diaminopimelate desuccinylase